MFETTLPTVGTVALVATRLSFPRANLHAMLIHCDHNGHRSDVVIIETNAAALRQNLGEMLDRVKYRHDSVLIKKDGKPVAALVNARLFERIRQMQDRFDALCGRIAQDFAAIPQDTSMAAIDAASAAVREEMKSDPRFPITAPADSCARYAP